jgi:hypothetical protein
MASYLSQIKQGDASLPPRTVLIGSIKIGKSTYASKAPDALFIAAEDGLTGLEDVNRLQPKSYEEVKGILDEIEKAPSVSFKTLVLDTLDWLERLAHKFICKRDKQPDNIEEYGGGWGKGDKVSAVEAVALCAQLDRIRHKHGVGVIILSHSEVKNITLPGSDPFDHYQMKGGKKWTGVFGEWPDAVLFAMFELFTTGKKDEKKVIQGERIIRTSPMPGWEAGNRYNLPDKLPLDQERGYLALLDEIAKNRNKSRASIVNVPEPTPEELREKIRNLAPLAKFADDEAKARFTGWFENLDSHPVEQLKAGLTGLEKVVG